MAEPSRRNSRRGAGASRGLRSLTLTLNGVKVLVPGAAAPPATSLGACLEGLRRHWEGEGQLAGLWQAWPRIAGSQLAPHCRPLNLQGGVLTVGAVPGPWLQALQYNRHQLLGALRGAGFSVRDLRFRQHYGDPSPPPGSEVEAEVWARHPSRIDVHGLADCPACGRPAPTGEMALWGHCSFCRRSALADQGIDGSPNC
jgi:predicted nucleic acid-binding Zn ribbon protein